MVMKYNITRNGELVKSFIEIDDETFDDLGLEDDTEYDYTVEIAGQPESKTSVSTKTLISAPPTTTIFVSNKELTWVDLPVGGDDHRPDQPDNGSLKLLSSEVRDNVPVVVETGKMVERHNPITKELEQVPETKVQYETRAVYTYEADFDWDNENGERELDWLVDVLQFKNNQLKNAQNAFYYMPAAQLTALPDLDTSNLTSMRSMFDEAKAFNQPLDTFDTSNVTNMHTMFNYAEAFNQPIEHFDTSSLTGVHMLFDGANAFNQPLNNWDTSKVTNMYTMFRNTKFDQDISGWCVQGIASKPGSFDDNSGFQGQTAKQPKWGQACNTVSEAQVVEEPKVEPKAAPKPAPRRRGRRSKSRRR